jgi:hypothetical protein
LVVVPAEVDLVGQNLILAKSDLSLGAHCHLWEVFRGGDVEVTLNRRLHEIGLT